MTVNEHENEWSRKVAEENIADLLESAKQGKVQTIVDFDGNFEVRFVAPLLKTDPSELSLPVEDGEVSLVSSGEPDITREPLDKGLDLSPIKAGRKTAETVSNLRPATRA